MERDRWEIVKRVPVQGAQGVSSKARDRETGEFVFLKELAPKNRRQHSARGRFRREAAAYATVQDAGLPRLMYDNSAAWEDRSVDLFMVLEWIDGPTLKHIEAAGPVGIDAAARCVEVLGAVLQECHARGVTHRDIKPGNVMLRDGDLDRPVLVDFGLSFNQDLPDDLTQIQEVGNRFLRLPEHAAEGNSRSHVSDVAQLAGLFMYLLTGREPRVLIDEVGHAPHRRDGPAEALALVATGRQLRRLNGLFDTAFAVSINDRYQNVEGLLAKVRWVLDVSAEPAEDVDAEFADLVSDPAHRAGSELDEALNRFLTTTDRIITGLGGESGLQRSQTGYVVDVATTRPFGQTQLKIYPKSLGSGASALPWITYRYEPRGGGEFVATVRSELEAPDQAEEIWRGRTNDDPALEASLKHAAKKALVEWLRGRV